MRLYRWYTPEEIQFVRKNLPGRSYVEMTRLFNKHFGHRITLKQMEQLAYKHKLYNGLGSINGHSPPNKGKTHPSRQGNYSPVGSERIQAGYIFVKVSDRKKQGGKNWKTKQRVIWEKTNGKIPKGHAVIFADGNKHNFNLSNLMLVSQGELGVMNNLGLIANHKDLTAVGKTIADIRMMITKRKLKKRSKDQKKQEGKNENRTRARRLRENRPHNSRN